MHVIKKKKKKNSIRLFLLNQRNSQLANVRSTFIIKNKIIKIK
jgi:hypothetical protein